MSTIPTLSDVTTRELLTAQRKLDWFDPDAVEEQQVKLLIATRVGKGGQQFGIYATRGEVTEELSKRPHVPGKREAKVIRQLQSKTGQTEQWLRAHPTYGQQIADACIPNRRVVSSPTFQRLHDTYGKPTSRYYKVKSKKDTSV